MHYSTVRQQKKDSAQFRDHIENRKTSPRAILQN
jgi:hypothetical protein